LISRERIRRLAAGGALEPIVTRTAVIDDAGARFVVRVAATLAIKAQAPKPRADPLGDYEPELFVGDVGPAHYALLNKFPVLPDHLLIVARAREPQDRLLTEADFAALAAVMEGFDGLGFYNGGRDAGASQGRKHLQLVPLPLAAEVTSPVPLEPLITSEALPFRHAFTPLAHFGEMHVRYRELLGRCGITALAGDRQSTPYNLLATRRWMLAVPRRCERYESISLNALAFAGSLFVRNEAELERVRRAGPMSMLRAVTLQ
jgi:sulfate adenylyltransferase (ADP) / ATP adenylyltransferase